MIDESKVEAAVDSLRENALPAARAKANRIYLEEYRKVLKSTLMRENTSESLGAQEARAYADPRYSTHLEAMKDAVELDEHFRWRLIAAEACLEAWRTEQANYRGLSKI